MPTTTVMPTTAAPTTTIAPTTAAPNNKVEYYENCKDCSSDLKVVQDKCSVPTFFMKILAVVLLLKI